MHQAERLEQVGIDVSGKIGRYRQRQRHQPQQHAPAGKIVARHHPRSAGADQECDRADPDEQKGRVEKGGRQHVVDQVVPHIGRRLQSQRNDRDHGRRDQDRGCDRDGGCGATGVHTAPRARPCAPSFQEFDRRGLPEISCQSRPCPPARPQPCGWRRSLRSATDPGRACRSPRWSRSRRHRSEPDIRSSGRHTSAAPAR